jgi:hypothetical protein
VKKRIGWQGRESESSFLSPLGHSFRYRKRKG